MINNNLIRATSERGKCDGCGKEFSRGDLLKQVCFATGSSGFVAGCCFGHFPTFMRFTEPGWENSGVWTDDAG